MFGKIAGIAAAILLLLTTPALAQITVEIDLATTDGSRQSAGSIVISESPYGLVFTPDLWRLPAGRHGFHLHQNPSCAAQVKDGAQVPALGAGGHYDPQGSGHHAAPWGDGHLGDLPALYVAEDGHATAPVLAPRLKLEDLHGRALVIHAGGDNYADAPALLGGGGERIACGVVK